VGVGEGGGDGVVATGGCGAVGVVVVDWWRLGFRGGLSCLPKNFWWFCGCGLENFTPSTPHSH